MPELPRASLLHKHGCTSHTVKKLFEQRIGAALFLYPSQRFPNNLLVASKLAAHSSNIQQGVRPHSYKGPSRSPYLICKQNQSLAFESQRKLCLLHWWLVLRRSFPGVELLLWPGTLSASEWRFWGLPLWLFSKIISWKVIFQPLARGLHRWSGTTRSTQCNIYLGHH